MKKAIAFLLIAFMALSVFAGGSNESNTSAATGAEPATVTGGKLVGGMNVDVTTYASWRARSGQEKLSLSPVYETLMRFDENGELQPYLAESLTADVDNLTYTVKLRDDVYFSDGSKLDADALLWNFENFKENSQTSATHFGSVESFEKVDDLTVVIHLKEWNTQIPYSLNSVPGLMYSKKAFDEHGYDWCLEHPVGTGPYILTDYQTDSHKTYQRNPNYWNKEETPSFDEIEIRIIADNMSAQAALISGDIDFFYGGDFQMLNTLKNMNYNIYANKMWYTIYFLIYGSAVEGSPLEDVRVRQAIAYAIDSDAISEKLDYGMSFVSNQYAVEGTQFYSDDVVGYDYNPEKAKQLLAEAGYPNGFSTKLSVGVDQALDRYMIAIQGYLKDVGIDVTLDYQETAIWTAKGIYETDEGMILAGHGFGANLVNQAVNNFSKRAIDGVGMLKNSKLHPDDLDAVLMAALSAVDTDEMLGYMHEAEKLIIDEYCLGYPVVIAAASQIVAAPDIVDNGFIASYNEYWDWSNISRVE